MIDPAMPDAAQRQLDEANARAGAWRESSAHHELYRLRYHVEVMRANKGIRRLRAALDHAKAEVRRLRAENAGAGIAEAALHDACWLVANHTPDPDTWQILDVLLKLAVAKFEVEKQKAKAETQMRKGEDDGKQERQ